MVSDALKLFGMVFKFFLPYTIQLLRHKLQAIVHRRTCKLVDSPKNVVVIGGSFTGLHLATRLGHTLPTGYRVILIEKNSHFNFSFNFPRYSVLCGHEARAFIPYDAAGADCPPGIFNITRGVVSSVEKDFVQLDTGERISYSYLAIASGSFQPLPAKVVSSSKEGGCKELQSVQENIKAAQTIAVIGGGAVGVEIATDIKSYYPQKQVTIVHSRRQLLPNFGLRLHDYVTKAVSKMGINLQLGERPSLPFQKRGSQGLFTDSTLHSSKQGKQHFDLIVCHLRSIASSTQTSPLTTSKIPCTGQRANSDFLKDLSPNSISATNKTILVKPTLQLQDPKFPHIFALGDVADTGGPKMARAGRVQAEIAQQNIVALIEGKDAYVVYVPRFDIEGSIKLTLGKVCK